LESYVCVNQQSINMLPIGIKQTKQVNCEFILTGLPSF